MGFEIPSYIRRKGSGSIGQTIHLFDQRLQMLLGHGGGGLEVGDRGIGALGHDGLQALVVFSINCIIFNVIPQNRSYVKRKRKKRLRLGVFRIGVL